MEELLAYEGREQTFIKHQFLTKYLQSAAYKTLQRRSPIFNFVDAFAGPWRVEDRDDYSDASFDQALRTLEAVRGDLAGKGFNGLRVRFCFCEKNPERAALLRNYAQRKTAFDIHVFQGAFEDNLGPISRALPDGFTFTFIDPTGWDIRHSDVFRFLRHQGGEFMLNFMSDHINRHSGYEAVAKSFGRFLADPDWAGDFAKLPHDWSNERKMLYLLKKNMKNADIAKYLPDFSIMLPRQERVKMRLLLGTFSQEGLSLFRDVQANVEQQEMAIRHDLKEEKTQQVSLFSTADHVEFEKERKGVGCRRYKQEAEKMIAEVLERRTDARYSKLRAHVMEQIPIKKSQVNTLACEMKKRGLVSFELPKGKRVPQPETRISIAGGAELIEEWPG